MPRRWKELMIFWRIHDYLPSNRAFTVVAHKDPRISRRRLTEKYGELPSRAAEQTALWYRLYKKSEQDAAVEDAHGAYLRYREMTALIASVMACFLAASVLIHSSGRTVAAGILIIVGEYFLLLLAARRTFWLSRALRTRRQRRPDAQAQGAGQGIAGLFPRRYRTAKSSVTLKSLSAAADKPIRTRTIRIGG
jgi:predicted lipid-binding transport protein (Tim44 family)